MNVSPDFLEQFAWEPVIIGTPPQISRAVVGGMGGSHLAADLLRGAIPGIELAVHHDYGLPAALEASAAIAVSHSGNTEETLDFVRAAHAQGIPCAAVSTGGALIEFAQAQGIPHIVLPESALPPRSCVGYHAVALLALLGKVQELEALRAAARTPVALHTSLAAHFKEGVPLIYSSQKNAALAHYLKVQLNETALCHAFVNTFPELNHNEMAATLYSPSSRVALIRDQSDDVRVVRRMDAFAALARERGIEIEEIEVPADPFARLVSFVALGQELSQTLAGEHGIDPASPSSIEDFKKRLS